jgi:hypothetical protein
MKIVTERNFDEAFPPAVRDAFWKQVENELPDYLEGRSHLVSEFRLRLEKAPAEELLLLFHDTPRSVAADILSQDSWNDPKPTTALVRHPSTELTVPFALRISLFSLRIVFSEERRDALMWEFIEMYKGVERKSGRSAARRWAWREAFAMPSLLSKFLLSSLTRWIGRLFKISD